MIHNRINRRPATPLVWWAAILGAVSLWFWLAPGDGVAVLPCTVAFAVTASLGLGGLSRTRSARRFNTLLDAYAQREIDREERRRNGPRTPRGDLTPGGQKTFRVKEPIPTRAAVIQFRRRVSPKEEERWQIATTGLGSPAWSCTPWSAGC
jgi:hypothetical protein